MCILQKGKSLQGWRCNRFYCKTEEMAYKLVEFQQVYTWGNPVIFILIGYSSQDVFYEGRGSLSKREQGHWKWEWLGFVRCIFLCVPYLLLLHVFCRHIFPCTLCSANAANSNTTNLHLDISTAQNYTLHVSPFPVATLTTRPFLC
jgi:hypothetical protein